jgi:hypothetical protein
MGIRGSVDNESCTTRRVEDLPHEHWLVTLANVHAGDPQLGVCYLLPLHCYVPSLATKLFSHSLGSHGSERCHLLSRCQVSSWRHGSRSPGTCPAGQAGSANCSATSGLTGQWPRGNNARRARPAYSRRAFWEFNARRRMKAALPFRHAASSSAPVGRWQTRRGDSAEGAAGRRAALRARARRAAWSPGFGGPRRALKAACREPTLSRTLVPRCE